ATTFTVGTAKTFTITTTSNPVADLARTGALPPGLSFTDNGDGTAKISGTATAAAAPPAASQDYALTLEASALSGNASQPFTLKVTNPGTPPVFTSASSAGFTTGVAGSFKVTTTGAPTAALTLSAGSLPEGVGLIDNGDGTATIAGTAPSSAAPAASSKNYVVTLKAKSGAGEITQSFTLTVTNPGNAPAITSANSAGFTTGVAGSFKVTTTASPAASLARTGELPQGVSFTDNGDGTATIAGTPAAATAPAASSRNYPITIKASNSAGNATQTFTLTVTNPGTAPAITSASATSFTTGSAGSFKVVATGDPTAALTRTGELPSGVTFVDKGDGTATLAGTPANSAAPPAGSKPYPITIKATNGAGNVSQSFTLTVVNPGVAPAITSANAASFTTGTAGSFKVTATGSPTPALSRIEGELPDGLSLTDNGDGTATIAGTPGAAAAPAAGSQAYPIKVKASSGAGNTTQTLTLNVANPGVKPAITTGSSASFTTGTAGSFKVISSGDPTATLTQTGELPSGVSFTDKGDGTAMIAGTPAASTAPAGSSKPYPITIKATNGAGNVTQAFTLTVVNPGTGPSITSAASTSFTTGVAGSFEVTATGNPAPALSRVSGELPPGVEFSDQGNGKATIAGTPTAAAAPSGGSHDYSFTIKATSGVGNVSQSFTLTVVNPGVKPAITSASTASFTTGVAGSFKVESTGDPTAALTKAGALPDGLSFSDNGDGSATIAGTAAESAASPGQSQGFSLTLKAKSAAGEVTQSFTLTVVNPGVKPQITSAASVAFTTGVEDEFTVSAVGNPVAALGKSGELPDGLSFTDNGDGTATIAGTPTAAAAAPGTSQGYPLTLEANSAAGSASQAFILTVVNPEQPPEEEPPVQGGGQPQPQPPVVTPPTTQSPLTAAPLQVALSKAKVELLVGRVSRKVVGVTVSAPALVTCKGKLPTGARCRVNSQGNVVLETTKALKRTGTFRLTIKVAAGGGDLSRRLTVRIG
ncbi:MAG TPA: hypothetical protein VFJ57_07515, partial [Solirubrobacterales bacterium]|nr:hypothetical protein [Solirubrobacterales bacterium]